MNPKDVHQLVAEEGFRDRLIAYLEKVIKLEPPGGAEQQRRRVAAAAL
jgi:hypothetical protein